MSQAQIESKVQDYLRNSQALEDYWQRPITAEQLQAEMDRMAQHTKQPEVLREIFHALGNDPFVIAECLARPVLAERLHRTSGIRASKSMDESRTAEPTEAAKLPAILFPQYRIHRRCMDDTWQPASSMRPCGTGHTAVWTGSEMIVWGGGSLPAAI